MKPIQIADQARLGLRRVCRITADGIRYRLFRASVTVAVIAVAVAFLMNILSESLIKRAVARAARTQLARARLAHEWVFRLSSPGTLETILRELAGTAPGAPLAAEARRMGALDAREMARLRDAAVSSARYLDFFAGLDYARRRLLVRTAEGTAILDRLAAPGGADAFTAALRGTRSVRFVDPPERLAAFAAEWPAARALAERVRAGRERAIAAVNAHLEDHTLLQGLADADGRFGDVLRNAGFAFPPPTAAATAERARRLLDVQRTEAALDYRPLRQLIARRYDLLPGDVNAARLWEFLAAAPDAAAFIAAMAAAGGPADGLTPQRLTALAGEWQVNLQLERAERLTVQMAAARGLGERMAWLLLVSLLVCGIGISNAMLMTVTERFREIATLKCLGALDGVIMAIFVLESCFLGVVGGLIGAVTGVLLGTSRMLVAFGALFAEAVPLAQLLTGAALAVVVGIALAAVAAVYPAFRAARLAPMEALRVE
jgi:putative ABC transport system permease protein